MNAFTILAFCLAAISGPSSPAEKPSVRAQGGVIEGTVVDSATGRPLAAAQVRIVGVGRTDVTHDDGTFRFLNVPVGKQTVAVQRIGYSPLSRELEVHEGETVKLRFALPASASQLSAVVVTGTVGERLARDLLSSASVLSGAELERNRAGTVAGLVERQPGVSTASTGPNTSRPVIRGLSGDRILLLEDGLRPGDLSSTSGDHAVAIEPLTAQQVEVVRGPMSLLYGPNALGGVVNVVRDEIPTAAPEHAHGAFSFEGTSANMGVGTGGWATLGLGRLALRGEATIRHADDLRTPVGMLANTGTRTVNVATGAALTNENGHAGASYRFYDSYYGIPGGFVGSHPEGVNIDMQRHMVRLDAERRGGLGPLSSLHATGSFSHYDHRELEEEGEIGTSFGQDLAAADIVARHAVLGKFSQGAFGGRAQWRDIVTGGQLRTPNTNDVSLAAFLVEELTLGSVSLQAGGRFDWARFEPATGATVRVGNERIPALPRTFQAFSGSIGALWTAQEWLSLGGSIARAYRTPDFNELYSNGPHLAANSFDVGDPRLDKETGLGAELFARMQVRAVRGELSVFRNSLDDFIYLRNTGVISTQAGRYIFQYSNSDALLTGADGEIQLNLTQKLALEATASYVRGRLTGVRGTIPTIEGEEIPGSEWLPFMPPLNGNVELRYETPRWFAGTSVRWATAQENLGDFETRTAGYGILNLSAGLRVLHGSRLHSLTLRADNVLDQEYREHLSRTKEIMPQLGVNVSLVYRLML